MPHILPNKQCGAGAVPSRSGCKPGSDAVPQGAEQLNRGPRTTPRMMSAESAPSLPTAALNPCATPRISVGNSSDAWTPAPGKRQLLDHKQSLELNYITWHIAAFHMQYRPNPDQDSS